MRGRGRLGVCDCHVHTALLKIDNQQELTVKKINKSEKEPKMRKRSYK